LKFVIFQEQKEKIMKSMRTLFLVISALLIILCAPLNASLPVCRLGGPTAMDTNRKLAEGETFVKTDRPLVVNLRFKPTTEHPEQVGECMLPSGTEVAEKNGILKWVKACGNDEVNQNILVAPVPTPTPAPTVTPLPQVIRETTKEIIREVPAPTPTPAPVRWGAMLSAEIFNSTALDGDPCIKGKGFALSFVRQNPSWLLLNVSVFASKVDDGSTTISCPNCETRTVVASGNTWGFKLGGIVQLKPDSWKVHPALMVNASFAHYDGELTRLYGNYTWLPAVEAGVGPILDLSKHVRLIGMIGVRGVIWSPGTSGDVFWRVGLIVLK
jgi:hypothetical protein